MMESKNEGRCGVVERCALGRRVTICCRRIDLEREVVGFCVSTSLRSVGTPTLTLEL